jgi:uncharacterized protein (DUF305 family)
MKYYVTLFIVLFVDINIANAIDTQPSPSKFMKEINTSMKTMDQNMSSAPLTGDVDHDFAVMMIPHHQGAIDMAKSELLYGNDPVMRRLAQEILVDQQSEIDLMNLWLKKKQLEK